MSGTPDLGTAWRLLDEARAELEKITAERDALRGEVAELRRTIRNINDARYATDDDEPKPVIMGAGVEHLLDGA